MLRQIFSNCKSDKPI